MNPSRKGLLACAVALVLMLGSMLAPSRSGSFLPAAAHAQDMTPRIVSGAVLDDSDQPVIGATVFLKNLKTKSIRSFASVEKGHYYFAQVSRIDDYELWAEKGARKSAVKTVSSWDSRPRVVSDLKLK